MSHIILQEINMLIHLKKQVIERRMGITPVTWVAIREACGELLVKSSISAEVIDLLTITPS
ncbi:MAG: hypothetical protein AAF620_08485 [Bacteroidota bacterium]